MKYIACKKNRNRYKWLLSLLNLLQETLIMRIPGYIPTDTDRLFFI